MTPDHRTGPDRRSRPTPPVSRYVFFGGRRRGVRRTGDARAVYVDRIGTTISILLVSTFLFHCLDALFTLGHLSRGGKEMNPLMDQLLRIGPGTFIAGKLGLAGFCLCFLGLHQNFRLVKPGIAGLFLVYAGLVGYHVLLLSHL